MKALVLFYSYGGSTRSVAEMIAKRIGADIAEIKTVKPYEGTYNEVVAQGKREVESNFKPAIMPVEADFDKYDTVVFGTPVWWYTYAPAVSSFFDSYSLKGKRVFAFATNGGWLGKTLDNIKHVCKDSDVEKGINIKFNGNKLVTPISDVEKWADDIIK